MKILEMLGERWGSNPRPSEPQSDALPTELLPPFYRITKLTFFSYTSMNLKIFFLIFPLLVFMGCSSIIRFNSNNLDIELNKNNPKDLVGQKFKGLASYYGNEFNGRKTASGEIFDNNKMTAAHKSIPFGTLVRVTNLKNNLSVIVVINDRGPFVEGRIIDLSFTAARQIDMIRDGVTQVEIEILE